MLAEKATIASAWLVVVTGFVALSGCANPPAQPIREKPVSQNSEAFKPLPPPTEMPELPPPKLEEVEEAVKRIFKDAVVIDARRKPNFLVGDFNGDRSQDLAVIAKPAAGKLSELNQQFPNWIAREPLKEVLADPSAAKPLPNPAAGQTVRFKQSDVLLAIIHGYGPIGWRNPEATQTQLLRGVVGTHMGMLPFKEAAKIYKEKKPFPKIYGDLIQQRLSGRSGFLHFAGAFYNWYDPKNYKPELVTGSAHP